MGKKCAAAMILFLWILGGCGNKDIYYEESLEGVEAAEVFQSRTLPESLPDAVTAAAAGKETEEESESEETMATAPLYVAGEGADGGAAGNGGEAVEKENARILGTAETKVIDLAEFPDTLSRNEVRAMVEEAAFPEYPYLNGAALTAENRVAIEARRNLDGIPETVQVKFGVLVQNAPVRSFPTWDKISSSPDGEAYDYFQQTMFLFGEGAAVLHQTADGAWSFVRGKNYQGWIETGSIAFCSRADMETFISPDTFLVAQEQLSLEEESLRMGTVLPLENEQETFYTVLLPDRETDGNLRIRYVQADKALPLHKGWLEFTPGNVTAQARKLIGMPYGWGDTGGNMDCSSTMCSVYRCFGIDLPRDTSAQKLMCTAQLEGLGTEEKRAALKSAVPGTLLYIPGHVMMYLGEENGAPVILHNVSAYVENGAAVYAKQCTVTSLEISRLNGETYWEALTGMWEIGE